MPDSTLPTESLPPPEPFGQFGPGVGDQIGSYRLLGVLGSGGFGVVFEAEQREPVRRRVALKVIKPGMDSASVIARFEAERQALAVMDHPCIAKIFDGGVTGPDQGSRPFFVMELVKGVPITEHCDTQRLTIDERCALFARVCDAVQHAHTKGVIHRDLKPSNILVGYDEHGEGHPKVIDFGVAKALNQRLSEATIFTERGQLIGTPEYMSPEQAEMSGQDIDTRADVYSLGVVLYELLTGVLPFDSGSLREAAFGEIQRIIREVDPPKPSTRLSTALSTTDDSERIIKARRSDARHLTGILKRDLDWVVLRSIEKNRERRYSTATDLAQDLQRFLSHEPLEAGPPSAGYRLGKFARRHRTLTLSTTGTVVALLIGIAGMTGLSLTLSAELEESRQRELDLERERAWSLNRHAAFVGDTQTALERQISRALELCRDDDERAITAANLLLATVVQVEQATNFRGYFPDLWDSSIADELWRVPVLPLLEIVDAVPVERQAELYLRTPVGAVVTVAEAQATYRLAVLLEIFRQRADQRTVSPVASVLGDLASFPESMQAPAFRSVREELGISLEMLSFLDSVINDTRDDVPALLQVWAERYSEMPSVRPPFMGNASTIELSLRDFTSIALFEAERLAWHYPTDALDLIASIRGAEAQRSSHVDFDDSGLRMLEIQSLWSLGRENEAEGLLDVVLLDRFGSSRLGFERWFRGWLMRLPLDRPPNADSAISYFGGPIIRTFMGSRDDERVRLSNASSLLAVCEHAPAWLLPAHSLELILAAWVESAEGVGALATPEPYAGRVLEFRVRKLLARAHDELLRRNEDPWEGDLLSLLHRIAGLPSDRGMAITEVLWQSPTEPWFHESLREAGQSDLLERIASLRREEILRELEDQTLRPHVVRRFAEELLESPFVEVRDDQLALDIARRAYALDPDSSVGLRTLAMAKFRTGDVRGAIGAQRDAIAAAEPDDDALDEMRQRLKMYEAAEDD